MCPRCALAALPAARLHPNAEWTILNDSIAHVFMLMHCHACMQWLATMLLVSGLYTVVIADVQPGDRLEIKPIGYQIIAVSLLGDAFIGFLQEYTMKTMQVRLTDMMAGVYTFSSVLVFASILAGGKTEEYFSSIQENPDKLVKPLVYGWLSYIGNCFVQTMIGHFGVLLTVSCLNVRQVRPSTSPSTSTS